MRLSFLSLALIFTASVAHAAPTTLTELQSRWVEAKYEITNKEEKGKALNTLAADARALSKESQDPEAKVWEAVVLATRAKFIGGSSALDDIRAAKNLLESALPTDAASVKDGYADALLGALYANAPSWPLSFGDKEKGLQHLKKALDRNPAGIDTNFFYGEYLTSAGKPAEARTAFETALKATPRPDRLEADEGRRQEIQAALAKLPQ
jgi:tetratricopeptide (TPR) repeat protein